MINEINKKIADQSIYQVFVRNYSKEGTFYNVTKDLDRIKLMGFDYLYLMPINKIGIKARKGDLGSPYAISDYYSINSEFGTLDDFKLLVNTAHLKGLKVMIDVVLNHTSPDSVLVKEHPEFFISDSNGNFGNKVGDWSDIIDLDFSNLELHNYLTDMLLYWVNIGVDGFRCDVAPMVSMKFWKKAATAINKVNPEFTWLAESVEGRFINELRRLNCEVSTDTQIYQVFNLCYDYDIYDLYLACMKKEINVKTFSAVLENQMGTFNEDNLKIRFLENHDKERGASIIPNLSEYNNWLGYTFFHKGVTFVYCGQEYGATHLPSLFVKDIIDMETKLIDNTGLIRNYNRIRKLGYMLDSKYENIVNEKVLMGQYIKNGKKLYGIFNIHDKNGELDVKLNDGEYINLIDKTTILVRNSKLTLISKPIIIEA
jgi:glycosidase